MAYGATSEEAQRLTQAMIDFASGSGATPEVMNQISLALGQIRAKGKLASEEVRQLVNAGLPVIPILAKSFGVTEQEISRMIEKGLIPADQALEAITSTLEDDFAGAAERSATSMAGLSSTLLDLKKISLRNLFTGFFEAVQPFLSGFVEVLMSDSFQASLKNVGTQVGVWTKKAFDLATTLEPLVAKIVGWLSGTGMETAKALWTDLLTAWDAAKSTFAELQTRLGPIIDEIKTNLAPIAGIIGELVSKAVVYWADKLKELLPLLREWGMIIAENLLTKLNELSSWANTTFAAAWPGFVQSLRDFATWVLTEWPNVQRTLTDVWNIVGGAISAFVSTVVEVAWPSIQEALKSLTEAFAAWGIDGEDIAHALLYAIEVMVYVLGGLFALLLSIITGFITGAAESWNQFIQGVSQVIEGAKTLLEGFFEFFLGITEVLAGILNGDRDQVENGIRFMFQGIVDMSNGFVETVFGLFRMMFGGILGFWYGFYKGFVGFWQNLYDTLVGHSIIPDLVNAIIKAFQIDWYGLGKGIIQGIINGVQALVGQLKQSIIGPIEDAYNEIQSRFGIHSPSKVFEKTIGAPIGQGIVDGAQNALKNMGQMLSNSLSLPELGRLQPVGGAGGGGGEMHFHFYGSGVPPTDSRQAEDQSYLLVKALKGRGY